MKLELKCSGIDFGSTEKKIRRKEIEKEQRVEDE
jgi:hypothetical protein